MFCPNCGNKNEDNVNFCTICGKSLPNINANNEYSQEPEQPQTPQMQYQQPAPQFQQSYQQPYYPMPVKKSRVGLWVFLIIFMAIIAGAVYFFSTLSLFGPRNLDVKYTESDFQSVLEKLDITIIANVDENEEELNIDDYNWEFSNYEHKKIELTPNEVTAFFNEIAPPFWWFKDTQVKIDEDGKIITSSSADISRILEYLFPDIADSIPIPLPKKANIYTKGDFSIKNNKISMNPESFKVGPIELPKQFKTDENIEIFAEYLDRFLGLIPGLNIYDAHLQSNGNFIFDAEIPTEVVVTPKGN